VSGDPVPPLRLADDVWWLGECLEIEHEGRPIHAYSSLYLVAGERASLLVDTGHPKDWPEIERQLDVLHREGVPAVAYVFPTHAEVPHAANLGRLLARYPDAVAVGDIRDYHLFFPEVETRLVPMRAGEEIDLGGRRFLLLEAVIRDLVTSLWGYDAASRTLFPGDDPGAHRALQRVRALLDAVHGHRAVDRGARRAARAPSHGRDRVRARLADPRPGRDDPARARGAAARQRGSRRLTAARSRCAPVPSP
jgi:hypothetical protein